MAVIYLRSTDGNDADSGATWALAKATLQAALTAAGAGGIVYVSDNHSEGAGSNLTITSPGTAASPTLVICVDDTGDPEPPTARSTGAIIAPGTGNLQMNIYGFMYCYGITFKSGTTASGNVPSLAADANANGLVFENCELSMLSSSVLSIGSNGNSPEGQIVEFINTVLRFANTSSGIRHRCPVSIRGGSIAGSTLPTTLIAPASSETAGLMELVGVDLSVLGSGKNLVSVAGNNWSVVRLIDCKLGASVTPVTGTHQGPGGILVEMIDCDSSDTNYRFQRQNYQATETQETTIVKSGGASDGTTSFARKVVTSANVTPHFPYRSMWIEKWNETTGSALTATVEIITDNVTLTDAEAWLEVEYLGTSGVPLGAFVTDRVSDPIFGTPASQGSSSVTWTTTGLTTPTKQKLVATFTPQEKGIVRARVCVAKASTTVYYDPLLTVA